MTTASPRLVVLTERRRFLGLLGGLGLGGLTLPGMSPAAPARAAQPGLSLREADFYRPHGLAG